jgi:hypothetical protein
LKAHKFFATAALLLAITLLHTSASYSQQVNITAALLNPNIEVLFLNDLNLTGKGISSDIFMLTMTNLGSQDEACTLEMSVSSFPDNLIASGKTEQFMLPAGPPVTITNQDLFSQSQTYSLTNYELNEEQKDFIDKLLATGKLPSNKYIFTFILTQLSTGYQSTDQIIIDISNPSTLDLIAPGNDPLDGYIQENYNPNPIFQWESNFDKFRLVIAEKMPGSGGNVQNILEERVILDKQLILQSAVDNSGFANEGALPIPSTYYQYLESEAYPLRPGYVYYWQVFGLANIGGSVAEMPSSIWAFRMTSSDQSGTNLDNQLLIERLIEIFGEQVLAYFSEGGELEGFTPNGNFYLNGQTITIADLQALLNSFENGNVEAVEIGTE